MEMNTPAASQAQGAVAANLEIFDAVRFDGMDDLFRVRVATTQKNAGFVWAESRTTHKQWQLDTEDFGQYCPNEFQISADRFIKYLKKGLAAAVASSGGKEATPAAGDARGEAANVLVISGRMSQDKLELSLALILRDVDDEPIIFRFELAYKQVTKLEELESKLCDVVEKIRELETQTAASAAAAAVPADKQVTKLEELESKLCDVKEKIRELETHAAAVPAAASAAAAALPKKKKTPPFVSLSAASATADGQAVTWNGHSTGPAVRAVTTSHFTVSPDNQSVTVLHRGLYQIHVRLGQSNNNNGGALTLRVNGVSLAQCVQADANGFHNSAQITEIMVLEAMSVLSVLCGANSNSLGDVLQTRFSVLLLHEAEGEEAPYLSLSAASATANNQVVAWNGQPALGAVRFVAASHFTVSDDCKVVTVLHRGLYQIHVRLGQRNKINGTALALRVNGVNLAQCVQADASSYYNSAQITEITILEARSELSVFCCANSNSLGDVLKTRFSVFLLQPLDE